MRTMTSACRITRDPESDRPAVSDPEVSLMLRVQRDEAGAFGLLVERYWSRVFARFYRQLGDRQEAEDLAQDVFLRVYRNRLKYRPTARFATWLYHIAGNVARNAVRARKRKPVMPAGLMTGDSAETAMRPNRPGIEEPARSALERNEVAARVRAAVAKLAGRQRRAVELQFAERTYGEIAHELCLSSKAAKSLLYRARNHLRETLAAFAEE